MSASPSASTFPGAPPDPNAGSGDTGLVTRAHLRPDDENPWIGLFSFTEDIRAFFHGRGDESEALTRMISRKTLTVLYGESGLGKSSLLQAGLFPRLRAEGFVPVYLRLKFHPQGPGIADAKATIRQSIEAALARGEIVAGTRLPAADLAPLPEETFWQYLHRLREGDLTQPASADGTPGKPVGLVLAFDQFEEIFTLGQLGRRGQRRGPVFTLIQDIADCIESRLPAAIKEQLEAAGQAGESAAAPAPIHRALDYRIVLSLRKDFVAELDDLRDLMPSVMENRMLLRPLDGRQALDAVLIPGRKLVKPFVARRIVRFVSAMKRTGPVSAPGTEAEDDAAEERQLSELQVDPSLLSMVCRELNKKRRQTPGQPVITNELVENGSRTILDDFYDECFRDQPEPALRRFVEDNLLNEENRRRPIDLQAAEATLGLAGIAAPAAALERLVQHRLLRIIDGANHGPAQLELAHDVLCQVVSDKKRQRETREEQDQEAASRLAQAHEREARLLAEAERQREEALEAATRVRRLRRARRRGLAFTAVLLAVTIGMVYSLLKTRTALRDLRATQARLDEYNLLASTQNFERARLLADRAILRNHNPGDAASDGAPLQLDSKGNVFALTHLARALVDNPWNADAMALASRLLLEKKWCPPLIPTIAIDDDDVALAVTPTPGGDIAAVTQSGKLLRWMLAGDGSVHPASQELQAAGIQSAIFSVKGDWLLTGTREKPETQLWRWDGGAHTYTLDRAEGIAAIKENDFRSAAFSADGQWMAIVPNGGAVRCRVFHRNAETHAYSEIAGALPHPDRVLSVDISVDGQWIVTASFDGKARLWTTDSLQQCTQELVPRNSKDEPVLNDRLFFAAFSPDPGGRWIAAVYANSAVRVWDTRGGDPPTRLPISFSRDGCNRIVFSPDGATLLSTSTRGTAQLWDRATGRPVAEPMCHENMVFYGGFTANGAKLVTASGPTFGRLDAVRAWDLGFLKPAAPADVAGDTQIDDAAPAWLAQLAEGVSGVSLSATGYEYGPAPMSAIAQHVSADDAQGPFAPVLRRFGLLRGVAKPH